MTKRNARKPISMRMIKMQQTRDALLKSAFTLFSERGYDNVTVEEITKHAGYSKGTFYVHFSAKEAVLAEHFLQVDDLYAEAYARLSPNLSTGEKLLRLVDTMCDFCMEECGVEFLRIIYAHQLLHLQPDVSILHQPDRKIYPILCEIAQTGKTRGEILSNVDNQVFAAEVMHLAHGIVYDWCMENGAFDLKHEAHRIFANMIRMAENSIGQSVSDPSDT